MPSLVLPSLSHLDLKADEEGHGSWIAIEDIWRVFSSAKHSSDWQPRRENMKRDLKKGNSCQIHDKECVDIPTLVEYVHSKRKKSTFCQNLCNEISACLCSGKPSHVPTFQSVMDL